MKAILTFHSIDDSGSVLSYPRSVFVDLMRTLERIQLPVCDLETLLKPETTTGLALTFDDGMRSLYTDALPVLRDYGFPAHLFLTTGMVGLENQWPGQFRNTPVFQMLDWDEIEICQESGVRIEAHTVTHPDLRTIDDSLLEDECAKADESIARHLGRKPRYLAYPYGYSDSRVRRLTGRRYAGCVTTKLRFLRVNEDHSALPRIDSYYLKPAWIHRGINKTGPRLYLWLRSILRSMRGSQ